MWECPCVSCVFNVFGARVGFDMDFSHIFPQGVLATITLIGVVIGVGISKACAECEARLPLCSVDVAVLSGSWSAP